MEESKPQIQVNQVVEILGQTYIVTEIDGESIRLEKLTLDLITSELRRQLYQTEESSANTYESLQKLEQENAVLRAGVTRFVEAVELSFFSALEKEAILRMLPSDWKSISSPKQ